MVLPLLLFATLLAASAPAPAPTDVVARIGDYVLTRELFEGFWKALSGSRRASYESSGGRSAFLRDLIDQKLVTAAAERAGYSQRPALRAQAELARDAVLYHAFVEEEVTRRVVTEAAMRQWYQQHPERFAVEETVDLRQIVVTPHREHKLYNESGDDAVGGLATQAKLERLKKELAEGADFAALAFRDSEDRTAADGGLLTGVPRGRLAKPLEDIAFSLPPGGISDVIPTPHGFWILRLEKRTSAHTRPFEQVATEVARAVAAERNDDLKKRFEELTARLRREVKVEVDEDADGAAPAAVAAPRTAAPRSSR